MSSADRYYTVPLSILRTGDTPLAALYNALDCGIVNAGIGYRESKSEDEFETLLEDAGEAAQKNGMAVAPPRGLDLIDSDGRPMGSARSSELWKAAHAGSKLHRITGGNRAQEAQVWATHSIKNGVFFKIRSDWLWNAIHSARQDAGMIVDSEFKPLSWREFRILAAILSAPVHAYRGFVFLGWETIQARSCGFHKKELFKSGRSDLPSHCQPLTRPQIDLTTLRMEANKFYLRFRYSKGDRGGKTAYSFRHDTREKLAAAVGEYQALYCVKDKVSANRAQDRELSLRLQAARNKPAT